MAYQGISNKTPYSAEPALLADEEGRDVLVVLVKATYNIVQEQVEQAQLVLAEEQAPICLAGEYIGEPGKSSLKYAPEANFTKTATDVALIGHAHAPYQREVTKLDVSLRVGSLYKVVRVFGDREWRRGLGFIPTPWSYTKPTPFATMPLVYERAFGGQDQTPEKVKHYAFEPRNLIGTGVIANRSTRNSVAMPNLEDPMQLIKSIKDRPQPAGFGFISPDWQPRLALSGTYDQAWQESRMPLLPTDFQRGFFNAAHPDLRAKEFLRGDETVEIINATLAGKTVFSLPGSRPVISLTMQYESPLPLEVLLDSLIIDTDTMTVQLLWRAEVSVYNRIYDMEKIDVSPEFSAESAEVQAA